MVGGAYMSKFTITVEIDEEINEDELTLIRQKCLVEMRELLTNCLLCFSIRSNVCGD